MTEEEEKTIEIEKVPENKKEEINERKFSIITKQRDKTTLSIKIIVIGDISVGKTSLIKRYCHQSFSLDYKATVRKKKKNKFL